MNNPRRVLVQRNLRIENGWQFLILNLNKLQGILGNLGGFLQLLQLWFPDSSDDIVTR